MSGNTVDNDESIDPKAKEIKTVETEILKRLDKLNKALLANDMLFVQLASLEKQQQKPQTTVEVVPPAKNLDKDNPSDINTGDLDLETNWTTNIKFESFEEDDDEEDD